MKKTINLQTIILNHLSVTQKFYKIYKSNNSHNNKMVLNLILLIQIIKKILLIMVNIKTVIKKLTIQIKKTHKMKIMKTTNLFQRMYTTIQNRTNNKIQIIILQKIFYNNPKLKIIKIIIITPISMKNIINSFQIKLIQTISFMKVNYLT